MRTKRDEFQIDFYRARVSSFSSVETRIGIYIRIYMYTRAITMGAGVHVYIFAVIATR